MKKSTSFLQLGCGLVLLFLFGCAGGLEGYNRGMYKVNKTVDKYTLKPIAQGYRAITPDPVEKGVNNFFNNVGEVGTMANSVLQGKLHNAAASSARLVWNTTIGLGGLLDVATAMNIKAHQEDFGQTLRTWGVPAGPYLVLPLLGPSTVTDSVGLAVDNYFSPINQYDDWSDHSVREGLVVLQNINKRAQLLDAEKLIENASTDEYTFVKNAYLQKRKALTRDGRADESLDEDLDKLFDSE